MDITVLRSTDEPERLVCRAARGDYYDGYVADVEFPSLMESVDYYDEEIADRESIEEAKKRAFIRKQLDRGHFGPWEHPQITFAIKGVSRALMAQITRHRHLTFDVQSQRFVDFSDKEPVLPPSLTEEQTVSRESGLVEVEEDTRKELLSRFESVSEEAFDLYHQMTEEGVPKEDARAILPIGTPVNMTMSGNARSMMHVLNLRQKANAQQEIRVLANRMSQHLEEWMPHTGEWWRENGPLKNSP